MRRVNEAELETKLVSVSTDELRCLCREAGMTCLQDPYWERGGKDVSRRQLIGWMSVSINLDAWRERLAR